MPGITINYPIRPAQLKDAPSIASLLGELGYPNTIESVEGKIKTMTGPNDALLVAEVDAVVCGLISIHLLPMIHASGLLGKVTGLVVANDCRGKGMGSALMKAAETFAMANGGARMEVISGNHRLEAYQFYQSIGYQTTDQTRFVRSDLSSQ